jgi:hypothetical protein
MINLCGLDFKSHLTTYIFAHLDVAPLPLSQSAMPGRSSSVSDLSLALQKRLKSPNSNHLSLTERLSCLSSSMKRSLSLYESLPCRFVDSMCSTFRRYTLNRRRRSATGIEPFRHEPQVADVHDHEPQEK